MKRKSNQANLNSGGAKPAKGIFSKKKILALVAIGVLLVSSVVLGSVLLNDRGFVSSSPSSTTAVVTPAPTTRKPAVTKPAPTTPVDTPAGASKKPK